MPIEELKDGWKRIKFEDFTGGYNLFIDQSKIKENEFAKFENLTIYNKGNFGDAVKRLNYERYNTNAISEGTIIKSIYEYITNNKAVNFRRLLVKSENGFCYCVDTGAFSDIATGLTASKWRFITFNDNCYIVNNDNGTLENKFYDGTNYLETGILPTPQSFKLTESTITGLASGTYIYIVTYLYDNGQESYPIMQNQNTYPDKDTADGFNIPKLEIAFRSILTTGGNAVLIENIPTGNARVVGRKIYRSKASLTEMYFLTTIWDNTTTSYIDKANDNTLTLELDADYIFKPMTAKFSCIHKNRLWLFGLKQNAYADEPDISDIAMVSSAGGGLSNDASGRQAKYSYKFSFIYLITNVSNSALFGKPYSGIFAKKSSVYTFTMTANQGTNTITGIDNSNNWTLKTAVFRNVCQLIAGASFSGSTVTITVTASDVIKVGETVIIEGVAGFTSNPNGAFVVQSVPSPTTFTITHSAVGGTYTASTGIVRGGTYYYLGMTPIKGSTNQSRFVDEIDDTDLVSSQDQVQYIEDVEKDNAYLSSGAYSFTDKPDIFITGGANAEDHTFPVYVNDNDVITGARDDRNGVTIFKNRRVYKYLTNAQDTRLWQLVPISSVGANDTDDINSIVKIADSEYIFQSNNNFYHLREGSDAVNCSEKIQTILDGLTFTNLDGEYDVNKNVVIYTYSTASVNGNELVYDLNVRDEKGLGKWSFNKKNTNDLRLRCPIITKAGIRIYGNDRPYLYKQGATYQDETWNGSAFVLENIITIIETMLFDIYDITTGRITAKIKNSAGGTLTFNYFDSDGTEGTNSPVLASGYGRINFQLDSNMYKRQYIKLTTNINSSIIIQELTMELQIIQQSQQDGAS